ncbi:hypothetical protein N7513_000563 [Penicillium frequentans]|nr:hypothetical protein N7513_000563 [Penicillium glabrum]
MLSWRLKEAGEVGFAETALALDFGLVTVEFERSVKKDPPREDDIAKGALEVTIAGDACSPDMA